MQEHVLYYFSGTGNSLRTALTIQKALGTCDVVSMGTTSDLLPQPAGAKSIGFVFPCYFGGVPHRVLEFVRGLKGLEFQGQEAPYIYAVVTYGAMCGSVIGQFNRVLKDRGAVLNYAATLKSFSNYVVLYDMSNKVAEKTLQTKNDLQPIVSSILERKTIEIKKGFALALAYNQVASKDVATHDRHFVLRESCNECGMCERVCPVHNIILKGGKPQWQGACEQCLACLHWCPERAIDVGEKTRKRGRYTNPEITLKMFIEYLDDAGMRN